MNIQKDPKVDHAVSFLKDDARVIRWVESLKASAMDVIHSAKKNSDAIKVGSFLTAGLLLMILKENGVKRICENPLGELAFVPIDVMYERCVRKIDQGKGWELEFTPWQMIYLCDCVQRVKSH